MDVCSLCGRPLEGPRLLDPAPAHPACAARLLGQDVILAVIAAALLVLAPPVVVWAG